MPLACVVSRTSSTNPFAHLTRKELLTEQVAAIISHLENIFRYASKTTINECWYGMYGTAKLKGGAVRLAEDRYGDDFVNESVVRML